MSGKKYRNYGDPALTRTTNKSADANIIRGIYEHGVIGFGGCALICGNASFQDGHVSISVGGVGLIDKGLYLGYASAQPSGGLVTSVTAAAAYGVGLSGSHGIDGNEDWEIDGVLGGGGQIGGQTALVIPLTIPGTHIHILPQLR